MVEINGKPYYMLSEVAKIYNINYPAVYQWVKRHNVPVKRVGVNQLMFVSLEDFQDYKRRVRR